MHICSNEKSGTCGFFGAGGFPLYEITEGQVSFTTVTECDRRAAQCSWRPAAQANHASGLRALPVMLRCCVLGYRIGVCGRHAGRRWPVMTGAVAGAEGIQSVYGQHCLPLMRQLDCLPVLLLAGEL